MCSGVVDKTWKLLTLNLFMVVVFLLVDSGSQVVVDESTEVQGVLWFGLGQSIFFLVMISNPTQ